MRLTESRFRTPGRGQVVLVLLEERPQRRLGRRSDVGGERFHDDRNHFDRGRLLQAAEVVPPPAGRITIEARLEQHLHALRGEHRPQGLEEVVLTDAHRPHAEPADDLVELLLPDEIVRPLAEEVVDRRVAHDHAVGLGLPREHGRPDDRPLIVGQQPDPRRIAAGRGRGFHQKAVEDATHGHRPLDPALPQLAPLPRHDDGIPPPAAATPHLQERRQHEEGDHGHDGQRGQRGPLIPAENVERAGHGTACGLESATPGRRGPET